VARLVARLTVKVPRIEREDSIRYYSDGMVLYNDKAEDIPGCVKKYAKATAEYLMTKEGYEVELEVYE